MRKRTRRIFVDVSISVFAACGSSTTTHGSLMGSTTGSGSEKNATVVAGAAEIAVIAIAKPGTFVLYCSVRGRRAAGMAGKVIVSSLRR